MRVVLLVAAILLTGAPMRGNDAMKITVSPAQSFAPANLFIRVSIEPNAENRTVIVSAESEDYYRSSAVALEGDQGPRTVVVQFRSVPGGHYEVSGTVGDSRGHELATAHQMVNVLGNAEDR